MFWQVPPGITVGDLIAERQQMVSEGRQQFASRLAADLADSDTAESGNKCVAFRVEAFQLPWQLVLATFSPQCF